MSTVIVPASPSSSLNGSANVDIGVDSLFRISVKQYHEMTRHGILVPEDRLELLEGLLVRKMSKNPPHRVVKILLAQALQALIPPMWFIDLEDPVTTPDSEPEPDVTVLRGAPRDYVSAHPLPADVALAVEVSDSSLARDRGPKKRIFARAGIAVYWIVNLLERQIEVYTRPGGPEANPDYEQRQDYSAAAAVPVVIDGKEVGCINVMDVLP